MDAAPRSKEFDDVYFSREDGLAETRHVFLNGNNLPEKWLDKKYETDCFTICETGFGTGLNFLAAWKLFTQTAAPDQKLHFISFEKFPLSAAQIKEYLAPWQAELGEILPALVKNYPANPQGVFEAAFENGRIKLTLIFGDVNEEMPKLQARIDAWFLDGFKPATNPDMWSETVFANMARLSNLEAAFATFTAAGFVRRGLQAAGFAVRRVPGFGRKREMLVGTFTG